jgi:hypothetical protein
MYARWMGNHKVVNGVAFEAVLVIFMSAVDSTKKAEPLAPPYFSEMMITEFS